MVNYSAPVALRPRRRLAAPRLTGHSAADQGPGRSGPPPRDHFEYRSAYPWDRFRSRNQPL